MAHIKADWYYLTIALRFNDDNRKMPNAKIARVFGSGICVLLCPNWPMPSAEIFKLNVLRRLPPISNSKIVDEFVPVPPSPLVPNPKKELVSVSNAKSNILFTPKPTGFI